MNSETLVVRLLMDTYLLLFHGFVTCFFTKNQLPIVNHIALPLSSGRTSSTKP